MKIIVTERHIERGIYGKSTDCALAIAINEALPGYEAGVGTNTFWVHSLLPPYRGEFLSLPVSAQIFVSDFDCRRLGKRWWHRFVTRAPLYYVFDLPMPCSVEGREVLEVPSVEHKETKSDNASS